MKCVWEPTENGKYRCIRCGVIYPNQPKRNCKARESTPPPVQSQRPPSIPDPEFKVVAPPQEYLQPPPLLKRLSNFVFSATKHIVRGSPKCTEEQIEERLRLCHECPLFKRHSTADTGGICTHESCGCNIKDYQTYLNKLAWADQKCPIDKWGRVDGKSNPESS